MKYLALSLIFVLSLTIYSCSGEEGSASTKIDKSTKDVGSDIASGDQSKTTTEGGVTVTKQSGALKSKEPMAIVKEDPSQGIFAVMKTSKGDMRIKLNYQRAPVTVANFISLAEGTMKNNQKEMGVPYFDGLNFHRVITKANGDRQDFMVQGGCPLKNGRGNPGYSFQDEFHPDLKHDRPGILSMANSGPATNGSQFFITVAPTPHLNRKHSVFGYVVDGMDVAMKKIKTKDDIISVKIERIGANAEKFDAVKVFAENAKRVSR